uniref:Leucine rich repeat (in FLII) interacting protein 1b n=1 Tax=Cyprinus carpio TaxID=7962 RepID=A0A8C2ACH4_CYPCA
MATQVTGRKRIPNREKLSAEDDALSQIAREAEARLAAKRAARAEAREIRMKELERQQKEGSRTASTLSAATLASLGGGLSRRGSCDTSISVDTEASIREMKDSLVEVEEKYRKAMVSNAQLDNEKTNLMYQVDTLRDTLMELEEFLCETRRECEEKIRDFERERHAHNVLKFQFEEMKETLKQSEELLMEAQQSRGKQVDYISEIADLQETLEWKDKKIGALERQKEYSDIIHDEREALRNEVLPRCMLHWPIFFFFFFMRLMCCIFFCYLQLSEIRLRKLVEERESLLDQVRKYKAIAEQKQKNGTEETGSTDEDDLKNGLDPHILDLQRDANRQISDLKFKLVKSEQEVTALEQSIIRLEGQVSRYKTSAEAAEKVEDELKVEKRKLQRELRSALDRIDELEASNSHLTKRLEKMKANRSALLAQQ